MDVLATQNAIAAVGDRLGSFGLLLEVLMLVASTVLVVLSVRKSSRAWLHMAIVVALAILALGEGVLVWFHWRLYQLAVVAMPDTGIITGHVAVPPWVESEKLFVWALAVGVLAVLMRRHRDELLPGIALVLAALMAGAALWGRPFSDPLPSFLGQYGGYLLAMASDNAPNALAAYQGMEASRQFYYNSWYMWVHPPLLFASYGAFAISFVATIHMVRTKYSAFETTAYRWARLGYLPLTLGMLLGFPWAILAWSGDSWWWSGKVNMSIMMWFLYTGYLHARLYLRRRAMWRWVAALAILSFVVLVLTYLATYVVPGAHSYV